MNVDSVKVSLAPGAPAPTRELHTQPDAAATRGGLHPPATSVIEVSDTARLLRSVLDALLLASGGNAGQSRSPNATPLKQSTLLPAPSLALTPQLLSDQVAVATASVPEISARVQQVLEESGVFYEAHQSRWLEGQFELSALRREPQARYATQSGAVTLPAMDLPPSGDRVGPPDAKSAVLETQHKSVSSQDSARLSVRIDSAEQPGPTDAAIGPVRREYGHAASMAQSMTVPAPLLPVLEQQLHYLTAGELYWRGEAWAGQNLEWRLSNGGGGCSESATAARDWTTTLRMQLPQLGSVEAQLRVTDAGVDLRLLSEHHALAQFKDAMPQLARLFEIAGVALRSVQTRAHD